jgi:hypothetical protein
MAARNRAWASFRLPIFVLFAIVLVFIWISMCGMWPINPASGQVKEAIARTKAKAIISKACEAYRRDHDNRWPDNLELLVTPDKDDKAYLVDIRDLRDPWGNQFQYDPSGPNNKGQQPDIWTTTPNGKVIGNW